LYESRGMAEYFDELDLSTGKDGRLGSQKSSYVRRQRSFLQSKSAGIKSDISMDNLSELERIQEIPLGSVELAAASITSSNVRKSSTSILRRSSIELATMLEAEISGNSSPVSTNAESSSQPVQTQTLYVLKKFSKTKVVAENQVKNVMNEAKILSDITYQHPFIVKMTGKFQTPSSLIMAFERLSCGDLWSVLYEKSFLRVAPREVRCGDRTLGTGEEQLVLPLVKFYAACVAAALSHLHAHNIMYRNLKPENIMIDDRGYIRLIGFGLAKKLPYHDSNGILQPKAFTICGTVGELVAFPCLFSLCLRSSAIFQFSPSNVVATNAQFIILQYHNQSTWHRRW
jgi:Protein kinase domain